MAVVAGGAPAEAAVCFFLDLDFLLPPFDLAGGGAAEVSNIPAASAAACAARESPFAVRIAFDAEAGAAGAYAKHASQTRFLNESCNPFA